MSIFSRWFGSRDLKLEKLKAEARAAVDNAMAVRAELMQARFDLAQTTTDNSNHWAAADGKSGRAALDPAVRQKFRDRSRLEAENNSWYSGILSTATNHVVGTGPRLQVLTPNREANTRLERAWNSWAQDIGLVDKLSIAFESYWRDGEHFIRRDVRPSLWPIQLDLRLIEAEQCQDPWVGVNSLDPYHDDGIRLVPGTRALEYFILKHHPADPIYTPKWEGEWYPASEVIHLYKPTRAGQVRGIPRAASGLSYLAVMRRFEMATVHAAEAVANVALYLKTNSAAVEPASSASEPFATAPTARNVMMMLPEGWDLFQPKMENPNGNLEMFVRQGMMFFARCMNMPFGLAVGTSKDSNFSSYKGDIRSIWAPEVAAERNRLNRLVLERIWRWFLEDAMLADGDLLAGLPPIHAIDHQWFWDSLPPLDELDAAIAAKERVQSGQSTLPQEYADRGIDFDTAMARGAAGFGVSTEQYKAAIFTQLFPEQSTNLTADAASTGNYTELGQRAFRNNIKRITDMLEQVASGEMTPQRASIFMQSIGVDQAHIDALLADVSDGKLDGQPLQAAAVKHSLAFGAKIDLMASAGDGPRRFEIKAYNGGYLPVDGYDYPVVVDLENLETPEHEVIPLLIDHEFSVEATLGQTDSIVNTGASLSIAGVLTGRSDRAQRVLEMSDNGHTWQASIGLLVMQKQMVAEGETVTVNGQQFAGPIIVARRAALRETSVLPIGADATTSVNLAAQAALYSKGSVMDFESWLASLGIDPATLSEEDRTALMLAYEAKQKPAEETPTAPVEANADEEDKDKMTANADEDEEKVLAGGKLDLVASMRKKAAAESRRIAEIQSKAAGHPRIIASAIEKGWSIEKTELEVLKAAAASRQGPAIHVSRPNNSPQVLEAAVCMARRIPNTEKSFTDQVLQAAHTQYRGRIGLQRLFLQAAAANGYHVGAGERIHDGNIREVLEFAMPTRMMQRLNAAAFSTVSLPGILSNVANKELLAGYEETDTAWREISQIKSVSDFKQVTSYRMLDNMEYEKVGASGEIKDGKLGEESYTRQVDTYAKMFSLTRRDIINDDLGAFDDLRQRLGRGAGQALNRVFWTTFLGALSTLFTSGRGNYISGATTNLGTDGVGLGLGVKAFRKLSSPTADNSKKVNANPNVGMGGRPEILLVSPELESVADKLYVGSNLNTGTAAGEENIYRNKYRPVVAWQLSDSSYTGYSTTQWLLLNNPAFLAAMVVSFLNGQETPTVESADADFDTLGVQFRGYHDFGCDTAEYLAGVHSKGAA